MLKKEGYDIFGITMDLLTPPYRPEHSSVADAAKVADKLGIPHCFLDLREKFAREVVDYFADSYLHGLTPSPCIMCNRHIKLGALADKARSLGADVIVTGHYADIRLTSRGVELGTGRKTCAATKAIFSLPSINTRCKCSAARWLPTPRHRHAPLRETPDSKSAKSRTVRTSALSPTAIMPL